MSNNSFGEISNDYGRTPIDTLTRVNIMQLVKLRVGAVLPTGFGPDGGCAHFCADSFVKPTYFIFSRVGFCIEREEQAGIWPGCRCRAVVETSTHFEILIGGYRKWPIKQSRRILHRWDSSRLD